jgi:hypothetical protein
MNVNDTADKALMHDSVRQPGAGNGQPTLSSIYAWNGQWLN